MAEDRIQRGIQSIAVGGALLKVLAEADSSLTLGELARRAGLPASKAHPYLVSFGALGLVAQDRNTGLYDFGPLALGIGLAALRRLNPLQIALSRLPALVEETHQTAALAVWGNHGATVVHIQESYRPLHVNLRAGTVMSLPNTATGNVFAAWLPDSLIGPALRREGEAQSPTIGADAGARDLKALTDTVRTQGLARTIGRPIPGVDAFSAPVFDHRGGLVLVVTILGPAGTFDTDWDSPVAHALKRFAADISHQIGFAG